MRWHIDRFQLLDLTAEGINLESTTPYIGQTNNPNKVIIRVKDRAWAVGFASLDI